MNIKNVLKYLKEYNEYCKLSGGVQIFFDDKKIFEKFWGNSCYEYSIDNNNETKFQIGSMTKQFTAYLTLILVSENKINLNDCINKYFPNIPYSDDITIHHLLSHTSGLTDYINTYEFENDDYNFTNFNDLVVLFQKSKSICKPGKKYSYSSTGYLLLGKLIEIITNLRFEEYLKLKILNPLSMTNTGMFNKFDVIPNMARGYEDLGTDIMVSLQRNPIWFYSSGGMYSNLRDLYLWNKHLISNEPLFDRNVFLKMFNTNLENYCYGLWSETFDNEIMYGHSGKLDGFACDQRFIKKDKVIILEFFNKVKNLSVTWPRCSALMKLLYNKSVQFPSSIPNKTNLSQDASKYLPGKYYFGNNPTKFKISIKDNILMLSYFHIGYGKEFTIYYNQISEAEFKDVNSLEVVEFSIDKKNKITKFGGLYKEK